MLTLCLPLDAPSRLWHNSKSSQHFQWFRAKIFFGSLWMGLSWFKVLVQTFPVLFCSFSPLLLFFLSFLSACVFHLFLVAHEFNLSLICFLYFLHVITCFSILQLSTLSLFPSAGFAGRVILHISCLCSLCFLLFLQFRRPLFCYLLFFV